MSIKTKIKAKRAPPARFRVRRIANKNPRNTRVFHQLKRKLSRVTASLLVFGLLASGMFLGNGSQLKSDIIKNKNSENYICAAIEIKSNFENLTTRLANLSRNFPQLIKNLAFCKKEGCAAEKKLYEAEEEIWNLDNELTDLKKTKKQTSKVFTIKLAEIEDGILFCENEEYCEAAEAALRTARICEKEFQTIEQLFSIREDVESDYPLINSKGMAHPAVIYAGKLVEEIFKNRNLIAKNEMIYAQCVAASDESVCQQYKQNSKESKQKITNSIEELSTLKFDLKNTIENLNTDIVSFEISKKDPRDLTPKKGKGWCENELQENKNALSEKINRASELKNIYEAALVNLNAKKELLKKAIAAEIEIKFEEVSLRTAAEKKTTENHSKAETIFGIWNIIRSTF